MRSSPLRLIIKPRATEDLGEQFDYYAEQASLETAIRFLDAAQASFEDLLRMPGSGVRRETENPALQGLRQWRVRGFEAILIFYQVTEEALFIARVLHGARDLDALLDEADAPLPEE